MCLERVENTSKNSEINNNNNIFINKIEAFLKRFENLSKEKSLLEKKKKVTLINHSLLKRQCKQKELILKELEFPKNDIRIHQQIRSDAKVKKQVVLKALLINSSSEVGTKNTMNREKSLALKNSVTVIENCDTLKINRAPKFLSEMEKRRKKRTERWNDIQERKRKSVAQKKENETTTAENFARKKSQDDLKQEKKGKIEIKERQRKIRRNLEIKTKMAVNHYEKSILLRVWKIWLRLMGLRYVQGQQADSFYKKKVQKFSFYKWKNKIIAITKLKEKRAEELYQKNLKKTFFRTWLEACKERQNQFQVATDWNNLKLIENIFKKWLIIRLKEDSEYLKAKEMADSYFRK